MDNKAHYISDLVARYSALSGSTESIQKGCEVIIEAFKNGGKMLVAGNGGSAADSDHISGELLKAFILPRKVDDTFTKQLKAVDEKDGEYLSRVLQRGLPCLPLIAHSAVMTATMNDNAGDVVFAQQVMSLGKRGDVFLGISTSGNSRNIVLSAITAKALGMKVATLTGRDGGAVKALSDVCIIVPETETYKIQELHLPVYHAICLTIEEAFFGR